MSKYRKNEEAIIRRVKQLKGPCPDFYIIGHSTSAMERLGLKHIITTFDVLSFISAGDWNFPHKFRTKTKKESFHPFRTFIRWIKKILCLLSVIKFIFPQNP